MWILTPLQSGGQAHYLLSGKRYVVGRKNCDILLSDDQSISRAHAQLIVTEQSLTLNDTSKYGTFVNDQQLTAPATLKSGDNVTFGVFHSKFSVIWEKPVVCTSCLDNAGKGSLSGALAPLGGKLVNTWNRECTHLAMPTVKVTIKTISALLCCCPIVKPEFFSELYNAFQQKRPPPKTESFVPEIDEPILNNDEANLAPIPARKQLFNTKTFIFLSAKQLKRLSGAVSFGGGKSHLLEEGSLPRDLLESPHSCVVDVMTNNSQSQLLSSSLEWANSIKNFLQSKGLRMIPESEIGLAAIYVSCDKYCNPACLDIGSGQSAKPRLPSASLSQNMTIDETVLAAPSQNITAYAVNTEPSQMTEVCEESGPLAVGETPEKIEKSSQSHGSKAADLGMSTQYVVADTMSQSFCNVDSNNSQKKKKNSKATEEPDIFLRPQLSLSKANDRMKTSSHKQFSQKPKTSAHVSPQKQSSLTSFFQPVSKKRPLQDEISDVMSESKRPTLESFFPFEGSNPANLDKEMSSPLHSEPQSVSQPALQSLSDSFKEPSKDSLEKPQSRKRKEMEEKIRLQSLLENCNLVSEDMEHSDDSLPKKQDQHKQLMTDNSVVSSSSNKRQRVHQENERSSKESPECLNEETGFSMNQSKKSDSAEPHLKDFMKIKNEFSKPFESPAGPSRNINPVKEPLLVENAEFLQVDHCQKEDETNAQKTLVKPEIKDSDTDNTLPQKLVSVEFRSLTVSQTSKLKQVQQNGFTKNFKCFRKERAPGQERVSRIIAASDLQVHNKVKNSDMDEWMRNAAEEERQNRRDESLGDDLFRYNPSKLSKRR